MADVCVILGDIGSAKEVVPAMQLLEKENVDVKYFCDASSKAKACDVLVKEGIVYSIQMPPPAEMPKVIVVGTSATAVDAQLAWTKFGHEQGKKIPVLWIEDLWGTGERKSSLSVWPTEMLVIDDMAAQIVQKVRPGLKVRVVGKPTFEKLPDMLKNAEAIRARIRGELGLDECDFLITVGFGGDPAERAVIQLTELLEHFKDYGVATFAWRFHPKHPQKDFLWDQAAASGIPYVDARKYEMDELNLASDLIIANWGNTDPYKALFAGIPVMTMLFPDDKDVRIAAGYPNGVPPIIAAHEEWGAMEVKDVSSVIGDIIEASDEMADYTRIVRAKPFLPLLRHGAAKRIAEAVKEYL